MPGLRLRALPILLAALWQTDGEHFGVPKSVLLPAFVQRARWADTPVSSGDRLEVVHFVGGGA